MRPKMMASQLLPAALGAAFLASMAACNSPKPAPSPPPKPVVTASAPPKASAPPPPASSAPAPPKKLPPLKAPEGMLLVPAGTFTMGQDGGGEPDERPAHRVTLGAFWLDKTEVTNEAYQKCVKARVCKPHLAESAAMNHVGKDRDYRKPQQPISAIRWNDADAYCRWVKKRLPLEAEWEHAARGDDGRIYPWGNDKPTHKHAVYGEAHTAKVGSRPKGAGPYGHLDMAGNVWEWMADYYDPYAYRRAGKDKGIVGTYEEIMETQNMLRRSHQQGFTGSNPIPGECERGLRGGAFNYHALGLRSSNRVHHAERFQLVMSGFRCAKSIPEGREAEPNPLVKSAPAAKPE